jgi:hypothetical protein
MSQPISFSVQGADEYHERWRILVDGQPAGEATVAYQDAAAHITAQLDVDHRQMADRFDRFHHEFSTELMAYALDRGAAAQESKGTVTYGEGEGARSVCLPSHQEVSLGHPNSY